MSRKSAHRDVMLWSYAQPSRGYFGYHLRARSAEARFRFRARIEALVPGAPHLLHLGHGVPDCAGAAWPRIAHAEVVVSLGGPPAAGGELALALDPAGRRGLAELLGSVEPGSEASVTVETPHGSAPLWVWWDAT